MPQCNARCTQSRKCMQGCRDRFNATQPQAHLNHEPTPFASICLCFLAFGIYCFLKARCHPSGKKHSQQPGQPQLHIIEIIFVALRLDALLSFLSLVAFISSISGTEVAQYTLPPAAVWPSDALDVNVRHQCAPEI